MKQAALGSAAENRDGQKAVTTWYVLKLEGGE